jgi:hypothetical protein
LEKAIGNPYVIHNTDITPALIVGMLNFSRAYNVGTVTHLYLPEDYGYVSGSLNEYLGGLKIIHTPELMCDSDAISYYISKGGKWFDDYRLILAASCQNGIAGYVIDDRFV